MESPVGFFQDAFRAAPVGMLVAEPSGTIVEANQRLELLLGYGRAQLVGKPVESLVEGLPEGNRFKEGARDLLGRHRDGHRIPVEMGFTPLRNGETVWLLASVVDLSERRRANEQFRLAIEAAPNGMLMVDEEGVVMLVNAQIEKLFGYARDELIGSSVDRLLPTRLRQGHAGFRRGFTSDPHARPMGAGRELFGLRKDGKEVPLEIGLSPLHTEKGLRVLASIVDITERRQSRELLERALAESEVLLKELHHRAKNNLQLISSLLDLASSSPNPQALAECRDRINSIALLHEKLYQSGTMARVELGDYLRSLTEQLAQGWSADRVKLRVEAEDFTLPLESAVPCGLVVNELVTNAFKHAFPGQQTGLILVRASRVDHRIELSVEDDGVGLPEGAERRAGHIGLQLVRSLCRQLHAELKFETAPGTRVRLTFDGGAT